MADNTKTAPPPLPFGTEAQVPKFVSDKAQIGVSDLKTVNDITKLVGQRVYDQMTIRGEIGLPSRPILESETANRTRQPFLLTCQAWIEIGYYLVFHVNPSEIQWTMPQRSAIQKTRVGEIMHIWKDRFRGTFYDEPELQITFQSGNIMPIRQKPMVPDTDEGRIRELDSKLTAEETPPKIKFIKPDPDETEPKLPDGLGNFYRFLELVDQQKIISDPESPSYGKINYVYMMYNSRIFPNLTLVGLFTPDGVSWTDSADNPNQVDQWTAKFTVYDSYPRLNDYTALAAFFRSAGFGRV